MTARILHGAWDDLQELAVFYEKQSPGLGSICVHDVLDQIQRLEDIAGIHSMWHGRLFKFLPKRFPLAVFYNIVGDEVRVHAILDGRRNLRDNERRLSER